MHMMIDYLTSKYRRYLDEGWGAFEIGNLQKAEKHFSEVLSRHDDPHMTTLDYIEAHVGLGAVNFSHKDFFESHRWYTESKHLLDAMYEKKWPDRLSWDHANDRPAMRTLIGLGHVAYHGNKLTQARKHYEDLIDADPHDELGVKQFLIALQQRKPFQEI